MARDALGDGAENLVRQCAGERAHDVRADTKSVTFSDVENGVAAHDAVDIGHVQAHLIHAHDPDDRAAPAANAEVSAIGERTGQPLPIADGRGRDPPWAFGSPGAPVPDALALGDRPYLGDAAEDVHRRSQ